MKVRRYFWTDRPCNVTRKEYERFQLLNMGLALTIILGLGSGVGFAFQMFDFVQPKPTVPSLTVQEAANYGQAERMDLVQLEGYLVVNAPIAMPDEPELKVSRGRLLLEVEADESEEPLKETLLDWEYQAEQVFLSDGTEQVAIAFPLEQLPMKQDSVPWPKVKRVGESARTSKPVAIEYADETYPLSEAMKAVVDEANRSSDGISVQVTREYLADGAAVVVQAALEGTPEGWRLVDPLGERLSVALGTVKEIKQGNIKATIFSVLFAIGMMALAFELWKKQAKQWEEFVARSNS